MFFQKNLPPSKKKASFRKKFKCPNALEQFCGEKLRWFLKHQVRKASTQHIFIEFICETRTQTVSSTKGGMQCGRSSTLSMPCLWGNLGVKGKV